MVLLAIQLCQEKPMLPQEILMIHSWFQGCYYNLIAYQYNLVVENIHLYLLT